VFVVSGIFHSPHKRRASVCGTAAVVSLRLHSSRHSACVPLSRSPNRKPKQMTNFIKSPDMDSQACPEASFPGKVHCVQNGRRKLSNNFYKKHLA
jgi:hypothetical protein